MKKYVQNMILIVTAQMVAVGMAVGAPNRVENNHGLIDLATFVDERCAEQAKSGAAVSEGERNQCAYVRKMLELKCFEQSKCQSYTDWLSAASKPH